MKPPIPANEESRLQVLHNLHILDTPLDENFERVTRLAKKMFNVPIVAINLIDQKRGWLKSMIGLKSREYDRDKTFCGYAINEQAMLVVPDARKDPRFCDNPIVQKGLKVRFYAGVPLSTDEVHKLGTLCILDKKPRKLTQDEQGMLVDLSKMLNAELQKYQLSIENKRLIKERDTASLKSQVDKLIQVG